MTNFFSIDPDISRIYMAATAPDKEDGTADGRSELGAIYALNLVDDDSGGLQFQVLNRKTFQGGTGSTPAISADRNAWDSSQRPKVCKLVQNRPLCRKVEMKLLRQWSPEQIAGWLKIECPGDEWNQVSHETIYRSLFIQAREASKKGFQAYLRSKRSIRRARTSKLKEDGLGSEAPMKTPTGGLGSTFPRAPTYQYIPKQSWVPWHLN